MTTNLFGTDGIRAAVGTAPFTDTHMQQLGAAIALWARMRCPQAPRILIAHDTRLSCWMLKAALKTGLLSNSVELVDAQILTTPALYYILRTKEYFDYGIMISASHNPYHDNGIKIFDARSGKISQDDEHAITKLYHMPPPALDYDNLGTERIAHNAIDAYIQGMLGYFAPHFLKGKIVVLDCANGAASRIAPDLFTRAGAHVITLHAEPNGKNINEHCGSTHPQSLQKAVFAHHADYGFAFDGDADRIIAVNAHGEIKDGDDIVALLVTHPRYQSQTNIVGTLMSNYGLEEYCTRHGKQLIRTNVGDKWVAHALEQHQALLGGEQSGHIIMKDYLPSGDGLYTALAICSTIELTGNHLMETFTKYPQVLINLPVAIKKDLAHASIARHIQYHTDLILAGRLIVRYSGTENLLRIMVEDKDSGHAQHIGNSLAQALAQELC